MFPNLLGTTLYTGTFHPDARNTSRGPTLSHQMSQGAEKFQLPEVGIEPGPQDLKANTLPRRCKSWLLPQGSRSALYTYPYYTWSMALISPSFRKTTLSSMHYNRF